MEQSEEYSDETYIRKVNSMTVQSIRTMSVSEWLDWAQTKYQVTKQFLNSPLGKKEKVIAILLGYSLDDWLALKKQDPQAATDLINATSELIEAVGIPTSYTSAALTLFGPFAKFSGKVNAIATKVLAKKLPLNQSGYVKKLISGIELAKAKLYKIIGKTPPKIVSNNPCFKINSFNIQYFKTQGIDECLLPFNFINALFNKITHNTSLMNNYKKFASNGHKIPFDTILLTKGSKKYANTFSKVKRYKLKANEKLLYDTMVTNFNTFKSHGIQIKKVKNFDLYFPDFLSPSVGSVKIKVKGNWDSDFIDASKEFIKQNPSFSNLTPQEFETLRLKLGLVWHHHEDLETMVLIDGRIHGGVGHWGSGSILGKLTNNFQSYWKKTLVYE